jgi:hypothetical protein
MPLNLVAFTKKSYFPFLDGDNDILLIGDMMVRPHYVVETERLIGRGLNGIATSKDLENFSSDDSVILDNISYFKNTPFIDKGTATPWAKNDINIKFMYGQYATTIPFLCLLLPTDTTTLGIVGASESVKLLYGSDKEHLIIKSDCVVRPHMIYSGKECFGSDFNGIITGDIFDIVKSDNILFSDDAILMALKNS